MPARWGATVRDAADIPVVVTSYSEDVMTLPDENYGIRLERRFDRMIRENVKRVDVIGSVCRSIRADLEAMDATAQSADIPNGLTLEDFQTVRSTHVRERLGIKPDDLIVLSVGRNFALK